MLILKFNFHPDDPIMCVQVEGEDVAATAGMSTELEPSFVDGSGRRSSRAAAAAKLTTPGRTRQYTDIEAAEPESSGGSRSANVSEVNFTFHPNIESTRIGIHASPVSTSSRVNASRVNASRVSLAEMPSMREDDDQVVCY